MDAPGPGPITIDEKGLMEWFEWGWKLLNRHLAKHAAFDEWCAEHRKEPA